MTEPAREVHRLVSELDYPMFIVTVTDGTERAGCLIGFATQCSIDPPRFLVCLSDKNRTYRVAQDADVLVVHLVPADADPLARLFGEQTGDEVDKFARCDWTANDAGGVVVGDAPDWFSGKVIDRVEGGDHVGFIIEPVSAAAGGSGFFNFQRAGDLEPGHPA